MSLRAWLLGHALEDMLGGRSGGVSGRQRGLGTTYGGDGRTTFALPKLAQVPVEGLRYIIAVEGVYPSRD